MRAARLRHETSGSGSREEAARLNRLPLASMITGYRECRNRRGSAAADHAVRRAENLRTAGALDRVPHARAVREPMNRCRELAPLAPPGIWVLGAGIGYLRQLEEIVDDPSTDLPALARRLCRGRLNHIGRLTVGRVPGRIVGPSVGVRPDVAGQARRGPECARPPVPAGRATRRLSLCSSLFPRISA